MHNSGLFRARWQKESEQREERRKINKKGWFWNYFQNVFNPGHQKNIWASEY